MTSPDPRQAYGGLPVMVWTAGPDRGCDYFNERWLEFTGRPLEQELGSGWTERIHPDDRAAALAEAAVAFEARHPFVREYRLRRADGEYRSIMDSATPRLGPRGEFLGYVGCCVDVSERRALERRLKQMERSEAIAQLAGGIAHDFNNLLTGIIGHCSLLLENPSLTEEARGDLEQIHRSADRAAGLTRQLLAFSRRQILAPRILDLNRVVTGTLSGIRGVVGSRIQVTPALAADLPPVLADPGQIEQILLQLATRAREAMPHGGRLEIRSAAARVDAAEAARHVGLTAGDYVSLSVRDTGPGLAPAELEHVFDPFFGERTEGGLGLGLAPVYGIVKQSGGYIAAASAPGEGTTFTVYLPRQESAAGARGRVSQEVEATGGSETVLLVEDEEQVRDLARRVLERAGYAVLAAEDAEAAVAIADRHPGHIHLLVTDIVLPRVSGRELAARLAIHRPAIKVLYVSGTTDNAIARHRMLDPGTEFLEKPFSLERLLQKVRMALGAPDPAARPV
ncbi:MAG TPA: ATP-binding protein [Gemmatimonadales bacterium]|nr:ATP-binding protein [Gemmatimonadales bacterium]